ncbi:hypothetical protein H2198_000575 [Neophaeococcomyces mojaviensis]|uniref:Uncharacterized protein n=1 Tax=Neophaeococcomyces mojaviensis TaxID=3383035 RepID=A0ACC3AJY1_9EURO|nr:hypothetical protein H2198_000575 [Knufia sp. JES_112]
MSHEKANRDEVVVPQIEPTAYVEDVQEPDDKPPDGGYGWVCIGACFTINGFTWGICASYGVYLSYYLTNNIFVGASDIDYAFVGGSNFAAALITGPAVNALLRKFGTRPVMFGGCAFWALGWITASWAHTLWQLVLSQGICVGIGLGAIWQPSTGVISQWFQKKRSMAQGITSAGSGFIGIIYSVSTVHMIEKIGLAWALRITGITSFIMLLIATYLLRDRNKIVRPTIHPFDTNILKRYQVWLVLGWSIFSLLGYMVLLYSLGNYGKTLGLSQTQAGIIITMVNLGTGIGRMFVGVISDRLGRVTVSGACAGLSSIACFVWWINAQDYGTLLSFGLVVGMIFGVYWACIAPISAEVVELRDLPSLLSLVWLTDVSPTLFSEAIALELRKPGAEKPYLYPQIYSGLCYLIAALFLLELRRNKWGLWCREKNR